ncbi:contractile injection system tape measure protein [Roseivirga sp. BDSF3-8]|uniref:contractile injection system tape measure protein n=1 Tax=Roseivirga sp. BDSF3-8 TaxID=3241598 RepID=UPI00353254EE
MSRHVIRSFNVEIDSDSEARGHQLNKQLNDFLLAEIVPEIERAMEDVAGGAEIWHLDQINLDLGTCKGDEFTDEFKNRLLFRFREALRSAIDGTPGDDASEAEKSDPAKSRYALLKHYLKHGTLPWWAEEIDFSEFTGRESAKSTFSLSDLIEQMLTKEAADFRRLMKELLPSSIIRKRLIRQLDDSTLHAMVTGYDSAIKESDSLVRNLLQASGSLTESGRINEHRENLWKQVFETFLIKKESGEKAKETLALKWLEQTLTSSSSDTLAVANKLKKVLATERSQVRTEDKNIWHKIQQTSEEYFLQELPSSWRKVSSKAEVARSLDISRTAKLLRTSQAGQDSFTASFFIEVGNRLSASSRQAFTRFILDIVFDSRYGRISQRELIVETVLFFSRILSMAEEDILRYVGAYATETEIKKWSSKDASDPDKVRELVETEAEDESDWTKWKNKDLITSFLLYGVIPWSDRNLVKEESLEKIFLEWAETDPVGFQRLIQQIDWKQKPFVVKRILNTFSPELADRILEQLPRTVAQLMSPPPVSLDTLLASPHLLSHYLHLFAADRQWSPMEWQPGLTIPLLLKEYYTKKPDTLKLIIEAFPVEVIERIQTKLLSLPEEGLKASGLSADIVTNIVDELKSYTQSATENTRGSLMPREGYQLKEWLEEVKKFLKEGISDDLGTINYKVQALLQSNPTQIIGVLHSFLPSGAVIKQWVSHLGESTLSRITYILAGTHYAEATKLAERMMILPTTHMGVRGKRWYSLLTYFSSGFEKSYSPFQFVIKALDEFVPPPQDTILFLAKLFRQERNKELRTEYKKLALLVSDSQSVATAIDDFVKGRQPIGDASVVEIFTEGDPEASVNGQNSSQEDSPAYKPEESQTEKTDSTIEDQVDEQRSTSKEERTEKETRDEKRAESNNLNKSSEEEPGSEEIEEKGKKNEKSPEKSEEDDKKKEKLPQRKEEEDIPEPPEKEPMFISNAGLVILHPFITRLFKALGLTENKAFRDEDAAHKAAHVLHFLVYHHTEGEEHEMVLEKVLCNIPLGVPLKKGFELNDEEKELCISLTKAAINYWEILKNSSVDNFRASFLLREGAIYYEGREWRLHVTPKGLDVLMEKLPWSIGMIRFPWMEKVLHVNWT